MLEGLFLPPFQNGLDTPMVELIGGAVGPAVAAAIRAIAEGRAAKHPPEGPVAQKAQPKPEEQPTAEGEQA